jgi:hypothetical protein
MTRCLPLAAAVALLAGCASAPTLYHWGSYENLVYARYAAPGKLAPQQEIEQLEKDRQQALAAHQRMPPGWHAHLGTVYYEIGKADQAQQEFMAEKAEFPESAVFIDRLVANLSRPTTTAPADAAPQDAAPQSATPQAANTGSPP